MSGFNLKRKMKRTKQQELKIAESGNRNAINFLHQQISGLANATVELQKNFMALTNVLKKRGMVDDLMLHRERGEIDEYEKMKRSALIIDPNKKEEGTPNG